MVRDAVQRVLPALLLILVALIVRGVAFEYRGKRDDAALAGAVGRRRSWSARSCPRCCGAWRSPTSCAGCRSTRTTSTSARFFDLLNPYALLGGLTTLLLFLTHGAMFLALKTDGDDPAPGARAGGPGRPSPPRGRGGLPGLDPGRHRQHVGSAVLVVLAAARAGRLRCWRALRGREGWAFVGTVVAIALAVAGLFAALFPDVMPSSIDPAYSPHHHERRRDAVHADDDDLGGG